MVIFSNNKSQPTVRMQYTYNNNNNNNDSFIMVVYINVETILVNIFTQVINEIGT